MLLGREEVLSWLPHRDPFLFVDGVDSIDFHCDFEKKEGLTLQDMVGCEAIASYRTKAEHPIFVGHFPGRPVLPGVVQIEMMAQVSSFTLFQYYSQTTKEKFSVSLVRVNEARFRKEIFPEMDLKIKAICQRIRGNFITNQCEVYWEDTLVSEAICMARFSFGSD